MTYVLMRPGHRETEFLSDEHRWTVFRLQALHFQSRQAAETAQRQHGGQIVSAG